MYEHYITWIVWISGARGIPRRRLLRVPVDFEVVFDTPHPITYSVGPDCRFTLTYSDSLETFAGVIVNGGMKILYIEMSGDPSRSGPGERIRSSN